MSSNQVAINEVKSGFERAETEYRKVLPAHIDPKRFIRVAQTAVQNNPSLASADKRTLFAATQRAAEIGLLPDGKEAAIVVFGGQAQFMPMLAGILKLIRNSGELESIDAQVVHAADKFTYRPGIEPIPVHEPDWFGDRGAIVGVYAVARMKDGGAYVEIMSHKQVEQVRNVSRAKNSGPWSQWWEEMARKTVLRRLAKRLPVSTDIDGALHEDDELFMPPTEQPAAPAQEAPAPASSKRPSRLSKIAEAAPAPDEDGVIDMPAADAQPEPEQEDESPI